MTHLEQQRPGAGINMWNIEPISGSSLGNDVSHSDARLVYSFFESSRAHLVRLPAQVDKIWHASGTRLCSIFRTRNKIFMTPPEPIC
jgi:hypothetical protein